MADIVSPEKRSSMMAGIRSKNTKPEIIVRKWLHAHGYRFRLHRKDLPGKPDIVLPRYHTVIFIHGCFWHRHQGCRLSYTPKTRTDWWVKKFQQNVERDITVREKLEQLGWKKMIIWECEVRSGKYVDIIQGGLNYMKTF